MCYCFSVHSFEGSAFRFGIASKPSLSTRTNSLSRCSFNKPVCPTNNSKIYGIVWWADGRPLISVVLWLWLSAVLHYTWMVIRLIDLHWKGGWTKPPLEPNYSMEVMKCWEEYSLQDTALCLDIAKCGHCSTANWDWRMLRSVGRNTNDIIVV